jgi:uncharacterized phage-associated protein
MAETNALTLAQHLVARCDDITNLKLQKLLYYGQGWYLALNGGQSLFDDQIEAWVHGPVVPIVFRKYRDFKWSKLPAQTPLNDLPSNVSEHIDEVLSVYGHLSPWDLERMTHSEDPWKEARGMLPPDMPSNVPITHESMTRYFARQANA